ncbi:MAG: hypothetical protein ACRDUA_24950 [Micromonosporaceae bacterium]
MNERPEDRLTDEELAYAYSRDEKQNAQRATKWPRRNDLGRITEFRHLLEVEAVLLVVGALAVAVIDALSAWGALGSLGETSGWLAGIMAFWLYVEEFRSWRGTSSRALIALAAGLVSLGVGVAVGLLLTFLPALISGALGVAVAAFCYAPLWFFGIRRAVDREA